MSDEPTKKVFPEDKSVDLAKLTAELLTTTDGTDVPDDFAIPAGEIRRILADL